MTVILMIETIIKYVAIGCFLNCEWPNMTIEIIFPITPIGTNTAEDIIEKLYLIASMAKVELYLFDLFPS